MPSWKSEIWYYLSQERAGLVRNRSYWKAMKVEKKLIFWKQKRDFFQKQGGEVISIGLHEDTFQLVSDLYFSSHIAVFLHPSSFCRWGRSREVVGCAASEWFGICGRKREEIFLKIEIGVNNDNDNDNDIHNHNNEQKREEETLATLGLKYRYHGGVQNFKRSPSSLICWTPL